ncbi:MAG: ABC transporter ATP-binding protein [Treponema sp.]|nr:ABC transporter ATP-binding protein [Treponema sp.]MCL2237974.1 ABC transporter ATP-binding protein [Treponema sp.]
MIGSNVVIEGISKSFGDFEVLKNVSMEIKKGEFFSLLGPSGCGKTTLLRIIAGFEHPDKGVLTLDGDDVLSLPPNKRPTNTVFQNYALFPHLTVFENVAFSPRLKGESSAQIKSKVEQYLKLVHLDGHADKKPNQLSGGMKQRVAIARALINEPRVLLLDEPLSALDAKLRQHMLIELDRIHDEIGITFIYVTHDQQEALSVSDRIAIIEQGQVLQIDTPHEIYESPATNFVAKFIGETNLYDGTILKVEKVKLHDFEGVTEYMAEVEIPELGIIKVTDADEIHAGQKVSFTVRPEKIVITKEKPAIKRDDINLIQGIVDEPIYSGFQTKFYVQTDKTIIRVIKQHANYSDEGPDIRWKDQVYLSWSAVDGYVVEVKK